MPDVCLSPPSPPAGPIPIPYPNFSKASDTNSGTKSVTIGGKEVGLKNLSYYKTSKGDEAATRTLGMGVITHTIQGKTQHAGWSFDVKVENKNVIRHLDLTTHNHASDPCNLAVTADVAAMAPGGPTGDDCKEIADKAAQQRENYQGDDRATVEKLGTESTTITFAKYRTPGGVTGGMKACSRKLATAYDNGMAKGSSGGATSLCAKATDAPPKGRGFKYRQTESRPHTSHTESRIIEDIMGAPGFQPGGTLLMSINWNSGGTVKNVPCKHCERVICAAQECGLIIRLCQGKPPQPNDPPKCKQDLSGDS